MIQVIDNIRNAPSLSFIYDPIMNLADQNPVSFQSNQLYLIQNLNNVLGMVENKMRGQQSMVNPNAIIGQQINKIIPKLTNKTLQTVRPALLRVINSQQQIIKSNIQKLVIQRNQQLQQNKQLQQFQRQDVEQQPIKGFIADISDINPQTTSIQRHIKQYSNLLTPQTNNLRPIQPDQLPQSMNFLRQYAKLKGTISIGPVSDFPGVSYVGVTKTNINGTTVFQPFPQNNLSYSSMPNISTQLQFHANNTINSWNKFVKDQAGMIGYIKKVNTPQKRAQYIQSQFDNLNIVTFAAQALATLTFYYVYLPLQVYIKNTKYQTIRQFTLAKFLQLYQVGYHNNSNPLLLNNFQGKQLCSVLLNANDKGEPNKDNADPIKLYQKIIKGLDSIKQSLNRSQINKVGNYVLSKTSQAKAFFINAGNQKSRYQTLLGAKVIRQVKKKKMVKLISSQDNQIDAMISIAIQKNQKSSVISNTDWTNRWNSTQIYCHDYIFKGF